MSREAPGLVWQRPCWRLGVLALVAGPAGAAQTRGDGPDARKRQAVEMCARELQNRERGRRTCASTGHPLRLQGDRVTWSGYMSVQRNGPDRSLRVSCTVRSTAEPDHQFRELRSGSGSGGSAAAATMPRAAPAGARPSAGVDVREVGDTADVGRGARLVMLRLDRRGELLCLYRGSATLYRPL